MKSSRLLWALSILAFSAWSWAFFQLILPFWQREGGAVAVTREPALVRWFFSDSLVRDPFQQIGKSSPPDPPSIPAHGGLGRGARMVVADSVIPPTVSAFLGGTPPMAILDSAGTTMIIRARESAFGWKVLLVGPSQVVLVRGSKRVVLE